MRLAFGSALAKEELRPTRYNESMKYYTLARAKEKLGINDTTLYRWLRAAKVKPRHDPGDWRRRRISEAERSELARKHHRLVVIQDKERLDDLEARISVLEQEVLSLSKTTQAITAFSDPLGEP